MKYFNSQQIPTKSKVEMSNLIFDEFVRANASD